MSIVFRIWLELIALAFIVYLCASKVMPQTGAPYVIAGYTTQEKSSGCTQLQCSSQKDFPNAISPSAFRHQIERMLNDIEQSARYRKFIEEKIGIEVSDEKIFLICISLFSIYVTSLFAFMITRKDWSAVIESNFLLHLAVIILIILVVTMFGLLGIFEPRDLIGIFSAITGYVLGQGIRGKGGRSKAATAAPSSEPQTAAAP